MHFCIMYIYNAMKAPEQRNNYNNNDIWAQSKVHISFSTIFILSSALQEDGSWFSLPSQT